MENNRGTKWSITLNNPTDMEWSVGDRPGWSIEGQLEKGKEGTLHYQGLLTTPKVAFSTIKAAYPRAHIERARNVAALTQYVHKADTRMAVVPGSQGPPSLFAFQHEAASLILKDTTADEVIALCEDVAEYKYQQLLKSLTDTPKDKLRIRNEILSKLHKFDKEKEATSHFEKALNDQVVRSIADGRTGLEYIASNPMWITAWRKYWRPMLRREQLRINTENNTEVCIIDDTTASLDEESETELHGEGEHESSDDGQETDEEDSEESQGDSCTESGSISDD